MDYMILSPSKLNPQPNSKQSLMLKENSRGNVYIWSSPPTRDIFREGQEAGDQGRQGRHVIYKSHNVI